MFALAATCAVLLAGPSRPRLPGALRLLLGLGAVLLAAAVGTSMVGLGYHYFTDIVAGAVVGIGMVLLTALVIDWAAARPPPARRPPRIPGDAPVPSRRDHQSMTGHLITGEASRRAAVPAAQGGDARLPGNRMPPERNREAMDDDELIAAVARGDDVALRELFRRHAPWLAGRLRGVLPAAEVEDVLQETFLAVWRGAGGYRPGSAGGWLWGIARRQAALWLRRRGPAELLLPALIAVDGRDPGDPAEAALSRAELAHAVSALGPEGGAARETWRLMYVEDKTVAEVAELMGVSAGTVKSRAHRARRLMRAALRHRAPARQGGGR